MFLLNSIRRYLLPAPYQAATTATNSSSVDAIYTEDVPDNVDEVTGEFGIAPIPAGSYLRTDRALESALTEAQWADPSASANRRSRISLSGISKFLKSKVNLDSLDFLSEGGFGQILKATNCLGDTYAIKVVNSEYSGQLPLAIWTAETQREVYYLSNFQHAHIVKVLDILWAITDPAAATPNSLFISMELLEVDLITVLHKYPEPMNGPVLHRLARQITSALDYLHRNGVVHHDIKPQNVMMANGRVPGWKEAQRKLASATWKLIDLGLCRQYDSQEELESSYHRGTALFTSPEKQNHEEPYNPYLADSYAWGLTLFLSLVGVDYVRRYSHKKRTTFFSILAVQPVDEYFSGLGRSLEPMEKAISQMIVPGEEARLSIGDFNQELKSMRQ